MAPILIAGPTASGKSALALAVARRVGGMILNADSMQVYRELSILTARPTPEEKALVPHRLYGHVSALEPYSVGRWLDDVTLALAEARGAGLRPIVVGGTGLYFKALTEGLSPVPPVPDAIRAHWRSEAAVRPPASLHDELSRRDPVMAARLRPTDPQRIVRALEVHEATGRSLAQWQALAGTPLIPLAEAVSVVLMPPRAWLAERCDRRLDLMMAHGALEEVRALMALAVPDRMPARAALGVPSLARHLAGALSLEAAVAEAKLQTRQYVKRQITWLKRHMMAWNMRFENYYCDEDAFIDLIVRKLR